MMDWQNTVKTLAPTIASALLGPAGGVAVQAIGEILGVESPTEDKIQAAIESAQLTPQQISQLKQLELQYQNDERERGFKYAEIAYKDRDSARTNNTAGGIQKELFYLSLLLLVFSLGAEGLVLFVGYPTTVPDVVVGRVLGLLDAVAMLILGYYYGTSNGSAEKSQMLASK